MRLNCWEPPTWNHTCHFCQAPLLTTETEEFCCNKGKHVVPPLPPLPPYIASLTSHRLLSSLSRRLNNLFCFTAIGVSGGFEHFDSGQPTVAITGRVYHRIFDVSRPSHSIHWFLYDEHDRERKGQEWNVHPAWTQGVRADLTMVNPYVSHLRQFADAYHEEDSAVLELLDPPPSADFAAIMHANNSTLIRPRSILIWNKTELEPSFIPYFSRHYEPLQYPLLFPHGTLGWGLAFDSDTGHYIANMKLSQREWYKGHLLTDHRFLSFGCLTCEYLCDMYSRIEEQRLHFIRCGRINHALELDPSTDASTVDLQLPSSFTGSHLWSSDQTADALAIARVHGQADFFITMTCDGKWPEISSRLMPNQTALEAPVIVVRAFKHRLCRLQDILQTKFGRCVYMITIIEFQKRGFPHAHIILKVG